MKVSLLAARTGLTLLLLCVAVVALHAQTPSTFCPVVVTNADPDSLVYDDYSAHTYTQGSQGIGTWADCPITRSFNRPIQSIHVSVVDGQADDIGYVGLKLVTSTPSRCAGVGAVFGEVDVTDQLTLSPDNKSVSLLLRAQENCCCRTGWGSATQADRHDARLHWVVQLAEDGALNIETPQTKVRASFGHSGPDGTAGTIHVALGNWLSIEYPHGDQIEDAAFDIERMVPQQTDSRTLFAGRTMVNIAHGVTKKKFYQTVHVGTAIVRVTPMKVTLPTIRYFVYIDKPARLGTTHNEFDSVLSDVAHQRGIPPQFMKGQVHKESNFVGTAYRYEPLSTDYQTVGPRPHGQDLRSRPPYRDYALATTDGLPQGRSLVQADIDPRNRYFIRRNNVRRHIAAGDQYVSSEEIYLENDRTQHWTAAAKARGAQFQRNPALLNYTAQTTLAASYGWFQVLYTTAISGGWPGVAGRHNPSLLFDSLANLNNGGGSVRVAVLRFTDCYMDMNHNLGVGEYPTLDGFASSYMRAYACYNAGKRNPNWRYGNDVVGTYSQHYEPEIATH